MLNCVGHGLTVPFLFVYFTTVRGFASSLVGVLGALIGAVAVLVGIPAGSAIDRFGPRQVLAPAFVVAGLGTAALGWASTPALAFGAILLYAAGTAPVAGAVNTIFSYTTDDDERARIFGLSFAAVNLGIGLGGLIGGLIVEEGNLASFQRLYALDGLTCVIPIIAIILMGRVGPVATGRQVPAGAALPPGSDPVAEPAPAAAPALDASPAIDAAPDRGGYRAVLGHRAFRRFLFVAMAVKLTGYAQFEVGFVAFATVVSGARPSIVSWAFTIDCVVIVLAQITVIRLLEGRSRSIALAGSAVALASAWAVLGLTGMLGASGGAVAVAGVFAFATLFAGAETLMSPVIPAITNALAVEGRRGRYNTSLQAASVLATIVGPLTAAPLVGHGLGWLWVGAVAAGALAAALGAAMLRGSLSPAEDGTLRVLAPTGSRLRADRA
jgi:MFS family permease